MSDATVNELVGTIEKLTELLETAVECNKAAAHLMQVMDARDNDTPLFEVSSALDPEITNALRHAIIDLREKLPPTIKLPQLTLNGRTIH